MQAWGRCAAGRAAYAAATVATIPGQPKRSASGWTIGLSLWGVYSPTCSGAEYAAVAAGGSRGMTMGASAAAPRTTSAE